MVCDYSSRWTPCRGRDPITSVDPGMRIAYQGEPGAYSEAAALRFNPDAEVRPCPAFEDVFRVVESGQATLGVLPIENSIGAASTATTSCCSPRAAHRRGGRAGGRALPAALPGTSIDQITQVFSHPQALAQCDGFLRSLAGVEIVATYDTAGSARLIKERQLTTTAAIASERAAEIYGLAIRRRASRTSRQHHPLPHRRTGQAR